MADGVMRFGAKDWANFKDSFKDANHDLFVELWALRKIGAPPKVVHTKDVGSAFGGGGNQLWRLDFGEAALVEVAAKCSHDACAQAEEGAARWVAIGNNGMVEQGWEC